MRADGTVVAWGINSDGQCDVPAGLRNVVAVAGGDTHSLALKKDGTIVGWGRNYNGQAAPPPLIDAIGISAGADFSVALRSNGTVAAWGNGYGGATSVPQGLTDVVAVAAGAYHNLALKSDGTVVGWGEFGISSSVSDAKAIAAGWISSMILKKSGNVLVTAPNYWGESIVPPNLSNVVQMATHYGRCAVLKSDGTVSMWGLNSHVPARATNFLALALAGGHSVGLRPTGVFIVEQPENVDKKLTETAAFRVRAVSSYPVSYQWQFNGVLIPGETNDSLTIRNVSAADEGAYRVVMKTAVGQNPSALAKLTASHIHQHPQSSTQLVDSTFQLSVGVTGPMPFSFQWFKNGNLLEGAVSSNLVIWNIQQESAGTYHVVVSNKAGSITSSAATLNVQCNPTLFWNQASVPSAGTNNLHIMGWGMCLDSIVINTNAWISIDGTEIGRGPDAVILSVAPNNGQIPRRGSIQIGTHNFVITQSGEEAGTTLVGQTLRMTISDGNGVFPGDGIFLFVSSTGTNNFFNIVPVTGVTAATNGIYTYVKSDATSATLGFHSINTTLTFVTPGTGSYISTNFSGDMQTGQFEMVSSSASFSGDVRPDLLWQDTNGVTAAWVMEGTTFVRGALLRNGTRVGPGWKIVGQADFNGDANWDILWQHEDGRITAWLMNQTEFIDSVSIRKVGPSWKIVGLNDFNNDGQTDILFQHDNGKLAVWHLNGAAFINSISIRNGQPLAPIWRIIGVADFNGDKQGDILMQHVNGRLAVWLMNGSDFQSAELLRNGHPIGSGWRAAALADLNNDGNIDIVFQHDSGKLAMWSMNGIDFVSAMLIRDGQPVAPRWRLVGPK